MSQFWGRFHSGRWWDRRATPETYSLPLSPKVTAPGEPTNGLRPRARETQVRRGGETFPLSPRDSVKPSPPVLPSYAECGWVSLFQFFLVVVVVSFDSWLWERFFLYPKFFSTVDVLCVRREGVSKGETPGKKRPLLPYLPLLSSDRESPPAGHLRTNRHFTYEIRCFLYFSFLCTLKPK